MQGDNDPTFRTTSGIAVVLNPLMRATVATCKGFGSAARSGNEGVGESLWNRLQHLQSISVVVGDVWGFESRG
jgi:hypothetical protein